MQDWLNAPEKDPDKGAGLLLAVTRNRALTNSYRLRPQKFQAKVEYELRKHLRMRIDNKSAADVAKMEEAVMPRVDAFISTSDELPQTGGKGKRPDHDSLPPEIQQLWEDNAMRYRRVVLLFNELKAMSRLQPCDRYEKLKLLDEAESRCRRDLEQYDSFDASSYTPPAPPRDKETVKAISAARKSLSKYRSVLKVAEAGSDRYASALAKVEAAVSVIAGAGAGFTQEMIDELAGYGIRV